MNTRRLAAILAADVVGYSRLVGTDEPGTLARLAALRAETVDPLLAAHGGRVFKSMGDGLLVEFLSGVQALQCAIALQQALAAGTDGLQLRIGLHSADVTVQPDGDLMGDGVNIAARLEPLAEPGGICISGRIREDTAGKIPLEVEDLGEPALKNMSTKLRVFRVLLQTPARPALALPDKPSLAVLPFQNMSGDPEQSYFADGVAEDILSALSRDRWLFVIARGSSFTYRGPGIDLRRVGRELGVRYVLEGSVRRGGERLRVTVQLADTVTGAQLWAEKYEGLVEEVFDFQDRITEAVAGMLSEELFSAEIVRIGRKRPETLSAYDNTLKALHLLHSMAQDTNAQALQLAREAIAQDPSYARGYSVALAAMNNWAFADGAARSSATAEALDLAERGVRIGRSDPLLLSIVGWSIAKFGRDLPRGLTLHEEALTLNGNDAWVLIHSSYLQLCAGETARAVEQTRRSMRLSPRNPMGHLSHQRLALAGLQEGDLETALRHARRAQQIMPSAAITYVPLASAAALAGQTEEASQALGGYLALRPGMTLTRLRDVDLPVTTEKNAMFYDGLLRAGLPP